MLRKPSTLDYFIHGFDQALRAVVPSAAQASRPNPALEKTPTSLNIKDSRQVAGLMRINHTGEVCAQALYHGQAFTAKLPHVKQEMQQAAIEEIDHLVWCETRLNELGSHTSILNPLWYGLSFAIGALAGKMGDQYSLGFVAETEKQVSRHLNQHLALLPAHDQRSRSILQQMDEDELKHRDMAIAAGAATLPPPIQIAMKVMSKVMTHTCYYI